MYAYCLFKECDRSGSEQLEGTEIEEFLWRLLKGPELREIFHRYLSGDRALSAPELLEFLEDQGKDSTTLARAQQLIHTWKPVIHHGHTLNPKILFRDAIQAVRDHAFTLSPYLVILSLENHCGLEQQAAMACHLHTILGDMLVTQMVDSQNPEELPSPEQLKGWVPVKGKKLPAARSEDGRIPSDLEEEEEKEEQPDTTFDPECPGPRRTTLTSQMLTLQQLPKLNAKKPNSIGDLLVCIEINGTLHFQLPAPELVLVLFVVEDYDSTSPSGFVGQFTLPLNSLKPGFRHIRLPCQGRGLTVISHALSTSVSSAAEGVADPPVVLQVPVLILWQKPSPPLE
ncbi:1-phosphatidylinositol 4; 5-bisphosphate phosphodiesterase delta-3 [Camelus dromedarius]|uniref:1-phosphatidylinositol 4 n=1 Tax=Camelus dromedarius TaxID=9838 RepID=A0A5N4EDI8_CAMDR|nr:1-phosphatidylinositol 4; 5-bisphosphate phosphodiesterase delta-3 [Camelus dromedarius]